MSQAWGLDNWEIGALKLGRLGTWRTWDLGSLGSWDPGVLGRQDVETDLRGQTSPSALARVITNKPDYQGTWLLG